MGAEKESRRVAMMAHALEVSRSGFCSWLAKGKPDDPWAGLREAVRCVWLESNRIFSARLVRALLPGDFASTTPCRVCKRMGEPGICGVAPDSRKRTTMPGEGAPARPGLVRRDFTGPAPAYKLVGDTTYLATATGLCARMVVGWAVPERMTTGTVIGVPGRAWRRGRAAGDAIFHSGRGSQHASRLLARWAEGHEVRPSVGRTGSCHGNAVAGSLFAAPKNEMCRLRERAARKEACNAVIGCIERRCNRNRLHSTIDYKVPAEVMEALSERTEPPGSAATIDARLEEMAA